MEKLQVPPSDSECESDGMASTQPSGKTGMYSWTNTVPTLCNIKTVYIVSDQGLVCNKMMVYVKANMHREQQQLLFLLSYCFPKIYYSSYIFILNIYTLVFPSFYSMSFLLTVILCSAYSIVILLLFYFGTVLVLFSYLCNARHLIGYETAILLEALTIKLS